MSAQAITIRPLRAINPRKPYVVPQGTPLTDRIRAMSVEAPDGCWIWTSAVVQGRYGKMWVSGKMMRAHRASYIAFKGPIPDGLVLDHLCRNRLCVNPDHLEAVTTAENLRRGTAPSALLRGSTHCRHGHQYTPNNTYFGSDGVRQCRECRKAANQRRQAKRGS